MTLYSVTESVKNEISVILTFALFLLITEEVTFMSIREENH
jgi:hypothetical protein